MSNTTIQTISIETLNTVTGAIGAKTGLSVGVNGELGGAARLGIPQTGASAYVSGGADLVAGPFQVKSQTTAQASVVHDLSVGILPGRAGDAVKRFFGE